MELKITIDDEQLEQLASLIAAKSGKAEEAEAEEAEEEKDDFGDAEEEKPKEPTLTDMQDAIREAVGKHGKEKVKAFVKKAAGVEKVADIPKAKYKAVLDGLKKVK